MKITENEFPTKNTIVYVKNIQDQHNTVEALTNYFKRFGSIINIKVDQSHKLAMVEFKNSQMANNAIKSKKILFGDKKIVITLDMNAPIPHSPRKEESISQYIPSESKHELQNQDTIQIKDELTKKLKFLIEIKKFIFHDENKKELLKLINEVKDSLKKSVLNEKTKRLIKYENMDLNINHSQFMDSGSQTTLENLPALRATLEVYITFLALKNLL